MSDKTFDSIDSSQALQDANVTDIVPAEIRELLGPSPVMDVVEAAIFERLLATAVSELTPVGIIEWTLLITGISDRRWPHAARRLDTGRRDGAVRNRDAVTLGGEECHFRRASPSSRRSSAFVPQVPGEVVGQVGHADPGSRPGQTYCADEQAHSMLLVGEDMLDNGADI